MLTPRAFQVSMRDEARVAIGAGARGVCMQLATGGGKTLVGGMLAAGAAERGKRAAVVAHMRQLVRQAAGKLAEYGVPAAIREGDAEPDAPVHVASIQHLARRIGRLPEYDLIIVDEAHHAVSPSYRRLFESQPRARIVGLTATPWRLNGAGLGRAAGGPFDVLICGPSVRELRDAGYLSRARVFAPCGEVKPSARISHGDYRQDDLTKFLAARPHITGDAIQHYARLAPGSSAIVYCASVAHAEETAERFRAAGWPATAISGETSDAERDLALFRLQCGSPNIVCACDVISEGIDCPAVGCVILLRPTQSLVLHYQQIGRGLRVSLGKTHVVVVDAVGNHFRHGFVDQPREWTLDGRPARSAAASVAIRQCAACWACFAPAPKCPECGYVFPAEKKRRVLVQRAGELVELTDAEVERIRSAPLRSLARGADEARLREIAKVRGFHPAWVARQLAFRDGTYRARKIAAWRQRKQMGAEQ